MKLQAKMSTRSLKSKKPVEVTLIQKRVENSWVMLLKEPILENSSFTIITLPHPGHGKLTKYCLDEAHKKMYEVITFSEPYRSWFIGDTVKSDGNLHILTPMQPLFLVLPRIKEQCRNRAVPIEDILSEKGFDKLVNFITNMESIADLKGAADLKAFKYSEEKTLKWLENRVLTLAKVLRDKNIHVTSGTVSATFVASNLTDKHIDDEFYLKYAYGIISEYLQDDLITALEKRFGFKPDLIESVGKKRKSEVTEEIDVKKRKLQSSENICEEKSSPFLELQKQKPVSAKEKARQKAASGTKTISSFFSKK